jgi:hypothetical protein
MGFLEMFDVTSAMDRIGHYMAHNLMWRRGGYAYA